VPAIRDAPVITFTSLASRSASVCGIARLA
jgi:hypothetical protein